MVFYNKDMFDAAGLPYPPHAYGDASWNYDKVREYGLKMTLDKNGNDATMAAFDPTQIAQWGYDDSWTDMRNYLTEWGAPGVGLVTTPDMKTAIINQKEWVTGLQWLSDGIWKDHFIPDAAGQATYGAVGNGDPFSTGMVSMFLTHTWFMPEGLTGINFKYDLAPVPEAPNGKQIVRSDVDGFAMIKGADEKDAAWEFMSWLVAPEQIVDVCLVYGCLPPVKAVESQFRGIMESKWPGLDYDVIYQGLNHLDNPHSDAYVVEQQKIGDAMNNALTEVYSGSQKDAKVLLDKVNADVQKILDEYWAKH
jgi:multiple sugar transport system substrate-binding protein